MGSVSRSVTKALFIGLMLVTPAPSFAQADEGLLQQLYRLLRPGGKYEGRLSDVLAKATQRGDIADTLPRVLLVDRRTGETVEWVRGRGTVEPVVCPDGRTLVVRRGRRVERAEIAIVEGRPGVPGAGTVVPDISVRQVFGCTQAAGSDPRRWDLWVEDTAGAIATVRLGQAGASSSELPAAFRADPPLDTGLALRRLQGLRSDGLSALVRDTKLVVERYGGTGTSSVPLSVPMPLAGDPAWLGDTDWIVVTGLQD